MDLQEWLSSREIPTVDVDGHPIPNWERDNLQRFPYAGSDDAGWIRSFVDSQGKRVCLAGAWQLGKKTMWKWFEGRSTNRGLTPAEKEQIATESQLAYEEQSKKRAEGNALAAKYAKDRWDAAGPAKSHPYLERKKILPHNLRVDKRDPAKDFYLAEGPILLVPKYTPGGELVNIQRIDIEGTKRYLKSGRTDHTRMVLGELAAPLLICEGFATGAALRQATQCNVVVCFSADNMKKVVDDLAKSFRPSELLVCADDDRWGKENTGKLAAEWITKKFRIRHILPTFDDSQLEQKPTDFNDLLCLVDEKAVQEQVSNQLKPKADGTTNQRPGDTDDEFVECLGHRDGLYYYTSSSNKQIRDLSSSAHSSGGLCDLMPYEYWEARYLSPKGSVNWTAAGSDLMRRCREAGLYDPMRVRGRGAWRSDTGGLVVHLGNSLVADGVTKGLRDVPGRHRYALGLDLPPLHPEPLSALEGRELRRVCDLMSWTTKGAARLLAGYASVFRVAGGLDWRPHLWVTGSAGCGKTETAMKMLKQLAGEFGVVADGGTTEAAIRQTLVEDSRPVLYDEAENEGSGALLRNLIHLIRQASRGGTVMKGTPGGKVNVYRVNGSFALGSIRTALSQEQDMSRFTVLELAREKKNDWPTVKAGIAAMSEEYGERLFSRMVRRFGELKAAIEVFSTVLSERGSAREADQLAALLGAQWVSENDEPVTLEAARAIADEIISPETREERRVQADEAECMEHLSGVTVFARAGGSFGFGSGNTERMSVAALVHRAWMDEALIGDLELYGMTIWKERLHIAVNHPELRKLFMGTKWDGTWSQALKRLPLAEPGNQRYSDRTRRKTVSIPLSSLTK